MAKYNTTKVSITRKKSELWQDITCEKCPQLEKNVELWQDITCEKCPQLEKMLSCGHFWGIINVSLAVQIRGAEWCQGSPWEAWAEAALR